MAAVTWNSLPKTMGDPTTISEYIAAQFATHNADDSAHGQSDEAIYNHRIAAIIDHLAQSVTGEKVQDFGLFLLKLSLEETSFFNTWQSLDLWTSGGTAGGTTTLKAGLCELRAPSGAGSNRNITADVSHLISSFAEENVLINMRVRIDRASGGGGTAREAYFGTGDKTDGAIGFRFHDGEFYTYINNGGSEYETELDVSNPTTYHTFRVEHYAGAADYFYVDNVLVHTEIDDVAEGEPTIAEMEFYIENTTADAQGIFVSHTYQSDL